MFAFTFGCLPAAFCVIPPYCCASRWFTVQPSGPLPNPSLVDCRLHLARLSFGVISGAVKNTGVPVSCEPACVSVGCVCTHTHARAWACIFIARRAQLAHRVHAPPASIRGVARLVYGGLLTVFSL